VTALRSIIALVGGFAIMAFAYVVILMLAVFIGVRAGPPGVAFHVTNLVISALSAVAGGYATAVLAPQNPRGHTVGLALMVMAMALSQVAQPAPGVPRWYAVALAFIGPASALLGGYLRRPRSTPPVTT
jgi:hypothetical protein